MIEDISIGVFDLIIFLGVFQGIFLSWFFLRPSKIKIHANKFMGFLLLFLSLIIFEELLNNTGYIVQVLFLSDFSESLNFSIGPLLFLYGKSLLKNDLKKTDFLHFVPAIFWLGYMSFYFLQPEELKYNSYIETKHPDWNFLSFESETSFSHDPLDIRSRVNEMTIIHMVTYSIFAIRELILKAKSINESVFRSKNQGIVSMRSTFFHFIIVLIILISTKLYYGMDTDLGGYFVSSYVSFMIFTTSYQVMKRSDFFNKPQTFLSFPKYEKSSLKEESKEEAYGKIINHLEKEKFYLNNLASLEVLAKQVNYSKHHVSQVINEKFNKNFFELMAYYRVEEAKEILKTEEAKKITIEELSEKVGYNSKSSFNTAFKKHTGMTPSAFREENS